MISIIGRFQEIMRRPSTMFLLVIAAVSLVLHIYLIPKLNIIEDESAYMQDAAQITSQFLPFRDFGGTKGPLWLFVFHGWQEVFGHSIYATRLFSSLAHVASIFLLWHFIRSFFVPKSVAYMSTTLWALSPVVVSLTTNITHIPLELCFVFAGFLCLRQKNVSYAIVAALFLFSALLMRATAIAFVPAALALIFMRSDRWQVLWRISLAFSIVLIATVAIIYPLYGWPKTAFFFNADATLIAKGQAAAYASSVPISPFAMLYDAVLPLRLDGKSILYASALLPFVYLWRLYKKEPFSYGLAVLLVAWIGSFILFYKGWGRSPTPFYPLESIPALAVAAGLVIGTVLHWANKMRLFGIVVVVLLFVFLVDLFVAYRDIPLHQYRGTVEVQAAEKVANILREQVRPGEAVFTAQPSFVYLANLPLYGGYTHPGWYLSERAGYMPAEIRRVFLPDFDTLAAKVEQDVDWIIIDWRTNDVYFNEGTPATVELRAVLENNFTLVDTISNPASRDIRIYKRNIKI